MLKYIYVINFIVYDMMSKFEASTYHKIDTLYLTEIIITEWIQVLDAYLYEVDTPYSSMSGFLLRWLI